MCKVRFRENSFKKLVWMGILIFLALIVVQSQIVWAQQEESLTVPKGKYMIAFSNGDMSCPWRWIFVDSMEKWAAKYKPYGLKYIWTNAHQDSARQLMDCETLLTMKPDMLIVAPNEMEPITPVVDKATKAGIPLIIIDREIAAKPGIGTYVTAITMDFHYTGMVQAKYVLEYLHKKYGQYKGKILEIQGILGSSPTIDEYEGLRAVLKHYPDVKIVGTLPGNYSRMDGRKVMEDFLEKWGPGQIDLVVCYNDEEALGALTAIEAAGRTNEFYGKLLGKDTTIDGLKAVRDGKMLMTTECTPYYGMITFETAIKYLNGEKIPSRIMLPIRNYECPSDDIDLTPGDDKKLLDEHIKFCEEHDLGIVPPEIGGFKELHVTVSDLPGYQEVERHKSEGTPIEGIYDLQNTK